MMSAEPQEASSSRDWRKAIFMLRSQFSRVCFPWGENFSGPIAATAALKRSALVFGENCPLIAAATAATMRASVESCCPLGPGAARNGVSTGKGALLLAVSRGRASEGVDFPDALARGVIMVGIPYPPLMDVRVRLKRQHNDANATLLGSGSAWYAAEAFRAVNQAVGRLIRHHTDFGAVLLLDYRYQQAKYRALMSAWLQPLLQSGTYHALPALLQGFFATRAALEP
ncbi:hypothetical protein WJX84_009192 [Apatococcus fuscideae]|uniref:ATP-dependent helicase C-terminal domain-containing protein n=1 Tax=Apatococcus fuscideae TaxID=2026836 RepID=A0AAW1SDP1_9CHLO